MYVEFIGLPGSGKSTLRQRIITDYSSRKGPVVLPAEEALFESARNGTDRVFRIALRLLPRAAGLRVFSRLHSRWSSHSYFQSLFLANCGKSLEIFLASPAYEQMSVIDRQRVIGHFLGMGGLWQSVSGSPGDDRVILFEEGLIQKSFMFVDHASSDPCASSVRNYLENIPVGDMVIHVATSAETAERRMHARPDGLTERLRDAGRDSVAKFLAAAENHLGVVTKWLTESAPGAYVVFDAEANFEEEYRKLTPLLDALCDKRTSTGGAS